MDGRNLDSEDASSRKGKSVMNYTGQSSSSANTEYQITSLQLSSGDDQHAPSETHQGFQGASNENGQVRNGPSLGNIDLNEICEGNLKDASEETGGGVTLNPPASDPSNPILISSGISGYVVEENDDGGEGGPSNGRRLTCKRRVPESSSGPLLLRGSSSSSSQQAGNPDEQAVIPQEISGSSSNVFSALPNPPNVAHFGHVNAGLTMDTFNRQSSSMTANGFEGGPAMQQTFNVAGHGAGFGEATGTNQTSMWGGQSDGFQRNIRLRPNVDHQFPVPDDYMSMMNSISGHANWQRDMLNHIYNDLVFQSISPFELPPMHPMLQAPDSFQSGSSSSSSAQAVNGLNLSLMTSHINPSFPGNASSSNPRPPIAPNQFNNPNMGGLYANRNAETGSGSEFGGWVHGGYAAGGQESVLRSGNVRPREPLRPRFMTRPPGNAQQDTPPALRTLSPAALRRSMLLNGVENALQVFRRTGALRVQDMMGMNQSMWIHEGGNEEDDEDQDEEEDLHEDLRLDTDNMSYEELLALEEQIGSVNTGLSEEDIVTLLRHRKHQTVPVGSPVKNEQCCICQEEYADGEDVGKLDCGHEFHTNCVKQWLKLKNVCPICKLPGLGGKKKVSPKSKDLVVLDD